MKTNNDMTPFNMAEKPSKQYPFLMPLIWGGSFLLTRQFGLKIDRTGMKGIKPPFLVIATHQGPVDYYVGPLALFPRRAMYVSDMEGFAAFGKWLYRGLGCIGKRRYVSDINVVKNMKYALSKGQSVVVYPESRHSNVGTTAYIPKNLGKLSKLMGVPVVILKCSGNYLANPFWDEEHTRKVPVTAKIWLLCNAEELKDKSEQELQEKIEAALSYDEYRYQQENDIKITYPKRAVGLHKALYQCRECGAKYKMESSGAEISCNVCNSKWFLTESGWLSKKENREAVETLKGSEAYQIHIPDWYEWERENAEADFIRDYSDKPRCFEVHIKALPNEKGFVDLGDGKLLLDTKEFLLKFDDPKQKDLHFIHKIRESVQTEYDYKKTGSCIVLSTEDCCYYLYSDAHDFNPTELQFIGEKLFKLS